MFSHVQREEIATQKVLITLRAVEWVCTIMNLNMHFDVTVLIADLSTHLAMESAAIANVHNLDQFPYIIHSVYLWNCFLLFLPTW